MAARWHRGDVSIEVVLASGARVAFAAEAWRGDPGGDDFEWIPAGSVDVHWCAPPERVDFVLIRPGPTPPP